MAQMRRRSFTPRVGKRGMGARFNRKGPGRTDLSAAGTTAARGRRVSGGRPLFPVK